MSVLDWIMAPLALICFALSIGLVAWSVPAPGLVAVTALAVAFCAYDFFLIAKGRTQRQRQRRDT